MISTLNRPAASPALSDARGRRPTLVHMWALTALGTTLAAASRHWLLYAAARFTLGITAKCAAPHLPRRLPALSTLARDPPCQCPLQPRHWPTTHLSSECDSERECERVRE